MGSARSMTSRPRTAMSFSSVAPSFSWEGAFESTYTKQFRNTPEATLRRNYLSMKRVRGVSSVLWCFFLVKVGLLMVSCDVFSSDVLVRPPRWMWYVWYRSRQRPETLQSPCWLSWPLVHNVTQWDVPSSTNTDGPCGQASHPR